MRQLEKPPSRIAKLVSQTNKQKLVALGLILILAVVIAGLIIHTNSTPEHQAKHKLAKVDKTDVPCREIRDELGNTTDYSQYSTDTQKRVLEKQMICFGDNFQYGKAITAAHKLEAIYAAEHDEARKAQIETTIQMIQTSQEQLKASNNGSSNGATR